MLTELEILCLNINVFNFFNLTKLKKLKTLNISLNKLKNINLENNINLTELIINNNLLKTINIFHLKLNYPNLDNNPFSKQKIICRNRIKFLNEKNKRNNLMLCENCNKLRSKNLFKNYRQYKEIYFNDNGEDEISFYTSLSCC